MLASEREESAGASWKEVWSERQAIDAASAQEDPSRKGSVSTLLSFVDSREDAPTESPGYSTTSCRSTSPSILFSPRQTHVTNSSISSLAPSSRATTTAASPTIFSSSYKITNPPPKSSAPATKLQRKSAIVVESENGLAKSQKQSGSREEPAPNNPRFVFPKPRPLEIAQSASHPFRVQSTSIAPVPSVFDPLPDSPKSKIISPALLAQPASDTLNSTHPAFQHKAPHPYRSSIASSFDSTYQQPYSFCQTFAFPHPALRKAHIDRSKSSAFSRRVPEADELSFRGVLKENQASQKEREEWQGRGRYPSDGGFRTPRRRRVFSEADGRSREWSPGYFRGRSGSMDAAIVGEQPPSPTVAHCSTLFSHLLPRRSGTLGANSTARHSTPEFHLFRRHSRKRSDATYPHTVYEKPLRRSASEETLVIRSISPEIQLGTAISNTSPAPSSPRARIVSTDEKEFVALPPRLRHSFSKSASDFFPRQQPPPLSLQTPDTSPVRRYRTPLSEGEARMQQEARLNLLLHQKLVAENDTRSPPVKTPLRLNKDLPPITPELVGSSRLSRKNTLEKAPDAPLPPLPNTPLLVTPPSARLSDSKLSNGSLHVPESPLDRDMLGGHYLSSPRGDREGSEGTSILDMDDEDDLYYRDLFFQAPRTLKSDDTAYSTMAIPRTPPSYNDSAKATFPLVFRRTRSMQELKSRRNGAIEGSHSFLTGLGIAKDESSKESDDNSSITRSESWRTADDSRLFDDAGDLATVTSHEFLANKYSLASLKQERAVRFAKEVVEDRADETRDVVSRQSFIDMSNSENGEEISFIDLSTTPVSSSLPTFSSPTHAKADDLAHPYRIVPDDKRKPVA